MDIYKDVLDILPKETIEKIQSVKNTILEKKDEEIEVPESAKKKAEENLEDPIDLEFTDTEEEDFPEEEDDEIENELSDNLKIKHFGPQLSFTFNGNNNLKIFDTGVSKSLRLNGQLKNILNREDLELVMELIEVLYNTISSSSMGSKLGAYNKFENDERDKDAV